MKLTDSFTGYSFIAYKPVGMIEIFWKIETNILQKNVYCIELKMYAFPCNKNLNICNDLNLDCNVNVDFNSFKLVKYCRGSFLKIFKCGNEK